jgi:predicted Fe-Mo cluster-binding NifX family protein
LEAAQLAPRLDEAGQFAVVDVEPVEARILTSVRLNVVASTGTGLVRWLGESGVDLVIAAEMSQVVHDLLEDAGIRVLAGAPIDTPHSLAKRYLRDDLRELNSVHVPV